MKYLFFAFLFSLVYAQAYAQISGNQAYADRYGRGNLPAGKQNFIATDSTLVITASVLLNQKADAFILTLGVSQEGPTARECLSKINERLDRLRADIKSMGIPDEAVFVDFIAQNKVYDYVVKGNQAEEQEKGFEVKKNIIIRLDRFGDLEKIILAAAEHGIYDVIKVDYLNADIEAIYARLFEEANAIAAHKKDAYLKHFKRAILGEPRASDNFYYVFPKSQYKEYKAFESAEVNSYASDYIKKLARKNATYYYEGLDYAGFDKIINGSEPVVGIQYVLTLVVTYDIQRNRPK